MFYSHVVQILFQTIALLVAEQANSQRFQRSRHCFLSLVYLLWSVFFNLQGLLTLCLQGLLFQVVEDVGGGLDPNREGGPVLVVRDALENAVDRLVGVVCQVLFLALFVLLCSLVLGELLLTLEALVAGLAFYRNLRNGTCVGQHHRFLLLLEKVLSDGCQLCDATFSVVNVELSGQVQLVVNHRAELDVAG